MSAGAPFFAGTALAARLERAEARLLADSAAGARRRDPQRDVFVQELSGGVAAWVGDESPLDKVAGLGFAGALDERELAEVEAAFAARSTPLQVEVSSLADPAVGQVLTRRGYVLEGCEHVLGRRLSPDLADPLPAGLTIERCAPEEFDVWLDVLVAGFAVPDEQGVPSQESFPRAVMEQALRDSAAAEGFLCFLARRDGEPAGGGSLRLFEGVAQLCGAATLPAHRRRGVQTALLETRLALAAQAGCDVAVVTTQPGSKSQENVQRRGFALWGCRAILRRYF